MISEESAMGELNEGMSPGVARNHLLAQHGRIRLLLVMATAEAQLVLAGAHPEDDFTEAVADLVAMLTAHDRAEEAMLEPLLRDADAWGPLRAFGLREGHKAEHADFLAALAARPVDLAPRMVEIAEDLDAHMEHEERTFLALAVARAEVLPFLCLSS